jgi:hypothetical protein
MEALRGFAAHQNADLHFGVSTETFGRIDVHTVVHDTQVGVTLGAEHGNLRDAITRDLGVLETNLRRHDLQLEGVRFADSSSGTAMNFSGGFTDANARHTRWALPQPILSATTPVISEQETLVTESIPAGTHAVSIHA